MAKKKASKKSPKKREGNPIHIKLSVEEALDGEKDLLNSEVSLLKISQSVTNYKNLRLQENKKKQLIMRRFGDIKRNLSRIQKMLPVLRMPKILEKEDPFKEEIKLPEKVKIEFSKTPSSVETQLREIQEKLNQLNSK